MPSFHLKKLYIYYIDPYSIYKNGTAYVLVITDAFYKNTWMQGVCKATTDTTIRVLREKVFSSFGLSQVLVSDKAKQFTSLAFSRFRFSMGIRHTTTTPYKPRANETECLNRNIKSACVTITATICVRIARYLLSHWLLILSNTRVLGVPPIQMMFGYPPNNPQRSKSYPCPF